MAEHEDQKRVIFPIRLHTNGEHPILDRTFRVGTTRISIRLFRHRCELTIEADDLNNRDAA